MYKKNPRTVRDLLKKYGMYSEELKYLNYHLNILDYDAQILVATLQRDGKIDIDSDITEEKLAETVLELIKKCDARTSDYNSDIEEEIMRIGIRTNRSLYNHNGHGNSWNNGGLLFDDEFEPRGRRY
ncbi:MAG TPA: hypothetical protein PLC53_01020 [Bacilli bacterium]|nr:hypothetical protein [Bacilli bacterium]